MIITRNEYDQEIIIPICKILTVEKINDYTAVVSFIGGGNMKIIGCFEEISKSMLNQKSNILRRVK